MNRKKCTGCLEEKNAEDFAFKNKPKNKRQAKCKSCMGIYSKKHYKKNKEYYSKKRLKSNRSKNDKYKEYKESLNCKKCSLSFKGQAYLCDFHHKEGETKEFNPSYMRYFSWDRLMAEIAKCDPLCSNCHRKEHHQEEVEVIGCMHTMIMKSSEKLLP